MGGNVLCGECKWLRTEGPCDQYYHYCGLDEDKVGFERVKSWHERAGNERMRDRLDGSCEMGEVDRRHIEELQAWLDANGIEWTYVSAYDTTRITLGRIELRIKENGNGSLNFFAECYKELKSEDVIPIIDAIRGAL